jgi:hypothetical protein
VRSRELRRILQLIVVTGLPVVAGGCVEAVIDTDCVDTVDRSFEIALPVSDDLPLEFMIDRCRVHVDACGDLCREALERNNVKNEEPTRCSVAFGDSSIDIDVSFEVFSEGGDCQVDDPPPPPDFLVGPQVRGVPARTFDTIWNGGRTCHA